MDLNRKASQAGWNNLTGPNLAYALDLYETFIANPQAVDATTRELFALWGTPPSTIEHPLSRDDVSSSLPFTAHFGLRETKLAGAQWLRNLRTYGHLAAQIDPLAAITPPVPELQLDTYKLSREDLSQMTATELWQAAPEPFTTALEAADHLQEVYTGTTAYEFDHVHQSTERTWLYGYIEHRVQEKPIAPSKKLNLLQRLIQVDEFESFLHKTYQGQKRFSIEGVDALVPMLDELIRCAGTTSTRHIMIGMAHRGRLNVLAHVLGKPYTKIFSEFHAAPNKFLVPSEGSMGINYGWTGDVKYHLGASSMANDLSGPEMRVTIAHNPSHLEFVSPVVEGYARAMQDRRDAVGTPVRDVDAALSVLIHGDAAFPGEGIVAETLNFSQLAGYQTGGAIHIIANNQLGFTADPEESRSTRYASDLAKGYEIPIVHVCADDPEACLRAIHLAHAYRQQFHKSFLIDLVGYRRYGHNEMDDPSFTQPRLYEQITTHLRVRDIYLARLVQEGAISMEQAQVLITDCKAQLTLAHQQTNTAPIAVEMEFVTTPSEILQLPTAEHPSTATGVDIEQLATLQESLLTYPTGFHLYQKLDRMLQRHRPFSNEARVDFGWAETLAFASILADGTPIRLTGQDSERGTFGHRHLVWHDTHSQERYCPLQHLPAAQASFDIYNSPLTEAAVLGFEYGYSVQARDTLVIWEAQFGDFANSAQVIIDQFIAAGRGKWRQSSSVTMLLPHGYEGQGPEHSSARLERYLQLSAEENWVIALPTTAAQYFHLLRLQAQCVRQDPRPLIIMTPKSLLRDPHATSDIAELSDGQFHKVIDSAQYSQNAADVTRVTLCTGKVSVDLISALELEPDRQAKVAIIRLEQLYPFPEAEVRAVLARYENAQAFVWAQEEPANMGAWRYVQAIWMDRSLTQTPLNYAGREEHSSPAEGLPELHQAAQKQLIKEAIQNITKEVFK